MKELAQQEQEEAQKGLIVVNPTSDYQDKYSHLTRKGVTKAAAHMLQANKTNSCVPVTNKKDTSSIEAALSKIHDKKHLGQSGEGLPLTLLGTPPEPLEIIPLHRAHCYCIQLLPLLQCIN